MPLIYSSPVHRFRDFQPFGGIQHRDNFTYNVATITPAKVAGGFITLPDGSKFRRTTGYARSKAEISSGCAAEEHGSGKNIPSSPVDTLWMKTGDGGFAPDQVLNAPMYDAWYKIPDVGFGVQGLISTPAIPGLSGNEAKTKALLKLADQTANMGENLATLGQTLRMLHAPVSALADGIKSVYRNRKLRPYIFECYQSLQRKGLLNAASEKYLEYVYGWKPLMQDIHGLVQRAKEKGEHPLLLSASHTAKREVAVSPYSYAPGAQYYVTKVKGGKATSKVRCKLYARIDPNWSGTRSLNQLGLVNPLSLAWELTSLSFVVDWLVPIGQVLNALTAPAGLAFVNGSISNRLTCNANCEEVQTYIVTLANWSYQNPIPGTFNVRYDGYSRQELTDWPLPGVWIDPDPLRVNSENSDRGLKAIALIIQGLKSFR